MQDINEVLREKETAIERVRREIELLRLATHLLSEESDSTAETSRPRTEWEEKNTVPSPVNKRQVSLAGIQARLVDARRQQAIKGNGSALLQFGKVALGASQRLLKRVFDSHLFEREPQRKTIRGLVARFGRLKAA